jgi:hypothetical protein
MVHVELLNLCINGGYFVAVFADPFYHGAVHVRPTYADVAVANQNSGE